MAIEINDKEVRYTVSAEADDIPAGGLALSSNGSDDAGIEREILARLSRGDVWAWCEITVTAHWRGFTGTNRLYGCSYKDEADFVRCGDYYEEMKRDAFDDLEREVNDINDRIHARRSV